MPHARRVKGSLLVIAGAVLVLAVVVLLVLLRSRHAEEPADRADPSTPSPGAGTAAARPRALSGEARTPTPSVSLGPASAPAGGSAPINAPRVAHAVAPPAVPSEIVNEPDPVKRAELLKMHKLASARVRVSMLRHRRSLLARSLERGRRDGSWSAAKVRQAEADLRQLVDGIGEAARDLEKVRTEVGGDIDR
jgi:hypothetical protein